MKEVLREVWKEENKFVCLEIWKSGRKEKREKKEGRKRKSEKEWKESREKQPKNKQRKFAFLFDWVTNYHGCNEPSVTWPQITTLDGISGLMSIRAKRVPVATRSMISFLMLVTWP